MDNASLNRLPNSLNNVGDTNVGSSKISQPLVREYSQHIERFRAILENLQNRNLTGSVSSGLKAASNASTTGGVTNHAVVAGGPGHAVVVGGVDGEGSNANRANGRFID